MEHAKENLFTLFREEPDNEPLPTPADVRQQPEEPHGFITAEEEPEEPRRSKRLMGKRASYGGIIDRRSSRMRMSGGIRKTFKTKCTKQEVSSSDDDDHHESGMAAMSNPQKAAESAIKAGMAVKENPQKASKFEFKSGMEGTTKPPQKDLGIGYVRGRFTNTDDVGPMTAPIFTPPPPKVRMNVEESHSHDDDFVTPNSTAKKSKKSKKNLGKRLAALLSMSDSSDEADDEDEGEKTLSRIAPREIESAMRCASMMPKLNGGAFAGISDARNGAMVEREIRARLDSSNPLVHYYYLKSSLTTTLWLKVRPNADLTPTAAVNHIWTSLKKEGVSSVALERTTRAWEGFSQGGNESVDQLLTRARELIEEKALQGRAPDLG
jgi:hypothetical protein